MGYFIYLRKSRADLDAESHGEGETLARHEKELLSIAAKKHLPIVKIFKEVVSGETLAARPVAQEMLLEVEQGNCDGVLVMEVERLARGDTIDQGIVAQAFKYSNTKIITPSKTYDPQNEFDEEYFEFGLFMSRREYKTINRRLERGRLASINEGKYIANKPPYGYDIVKLVGEKGFTLKPNESEANIVKLIFELYAIGQKQSDGTFKQMGSTNIAKYLNEINAAKRTPGPWQAQTIASILRNPTYLGKIKWGMRGQEKKIVNGEIKISRPRKSIDDILLVDGLHSPLVSEEIWQEANRIMKGHIVTSTPIGLSVVNPLVGVMVCSKCGKKMVRRPYKNSVAALICTNTNCDNASAPLHLVEQSVLSMLKNDLNKLKVDVQKNKKKYTQDNSAEKSLASNIVELKKLSKQIDSLHDFLEQGIYDSQTFITRNKILSDKINEISLNNDLLEKEIETKRIEKNLAETIIPRIENVLRLYDTLDSPEEKNKLLKSVVESVSYTKESGGRWRVSPDDFKVVTNLLITP